MKKNVYLKKIVLFLAIVITFFIIQILCKPVFETNDDRTMRSIINGTFTGKPDGHAIFMSYILGWILSRLYILIPNVPWYGLFFGLCIVMSAYLVLSEILFRSYKDKAERITGCVIAVLLFFCIYLNSFIVQQFTVVAGVLAGTAVFSILTKKKKVVSLLFMIITFMVRKNVFLMASPFIIAATLWNVIYDDSKIKVGRLIKKTVPILVIIISIFSVGTIVENMAYSSADWKQYKEYNSIRSQLYDYTSIMPYEDCEKQLSVSGIDRNTYSLIQTYNIYMNNEIDAKTLKKVKEINDINSDSTNIANKVIKTMISMIKAMIKDYWHYNLILLILYIVVLVNYFKSKKNLCAFGFLVIIGKYTMVYYLLFSGRIPDRVYKALFLIEIAFWIAIALKDISNKIKPSHIIKIGICLLVCLCVGKQLRNNFYQLNWQQTNCITKFETLGKECKDEYLMLDIHSFYYISGYVFEEEQYRNILYLEPWTCGSPLLKEKMNRFGIDSWDQLLLRFPNSNFVIEKKDYSWLKDYYQEKEEKVNIVVKRKLKVGNTEILCLKLE